MQFADCTGPPVASEDDLLQEVDAEAALAHAQLAKLEAVLADAQRGGLPAGEVARAREALLALEAESMRSHAAMVVEDAIASGDFWMLQAAMQTAVSCGLVDEQVERLREAMRAPGREAHAVQSQ